MECLCLDESSCLRLASSLPPLHYLRIFVLPPPRFPCAFPRLLLAVAPVSPHLFPPRFPMPSYSSSPASSSHFSPLPPYLPCVFLLFAAPAPPASSLSAFPCHRLAASTSTPVSSPLRFPTPSGKSLFATTRAFPLTGILFVLFLVRGFVEVCALLLRQAGGLPPLLGIKFIYRCKCDFLQKMYFLDEKNREMLADSKKVPTFASAFEK